MTPDMTVPREATEEMLWTARLSAHEAFYTTPVGRLLLIYQNTASYANYLDAKADGEMTPEVMAAWKASKTALDELIAALDAPEPFIKTVERILDEESAWIARPNADVTRRVAFGAVVAYQAGAAAPAPTPDDFVAVPREATEEMLEAGETALRGYLAFAFPVKKLWAAMIAAAPPPQPEPTAPWIPERDRLFVQTSPPLGDHPIRVPQPEPGWQEERAAMLDYLREYQDGMGEQESELLRFVGFFIGVLERGDHRPDPPKETKP